MPSLPPPTDALVPFDFPTTGRGLRATRHLQAGIPVLRIPFADLYTIRSAEALFPGARALPELAAVTAFLAHHRFLGSGSPLAGYIASLPTDFSGWPAMLPQRAVDALPIELRKRVMDQRRLMETHFKAVLNSLEFGSSFGAFIRKDFARSWLLVNSRCVSVDFRDGGPRATLALAPFFDLFNHDPTVSSQIACNPATRTLDVVLDRDVPEGEQCFIFYGPHDDESLLLEYGFTLPNNPYEGVSLDGEFAGCGPEREQGPLRELCLALLEEEGFNGDYVVGRNEVSHRLTMAALLRTDLASAPSRMDEVAEAWRRRVRGLDPVADAEDFTADSVSYILRLLELRLERLQRDSEALEKLGMPELDMVRAICEGKRSIIASCTAYILGLRDQQQTHPPYP